MYTVALPINQTVTCMHIIGLCNLLLSLVALIFAHGLWAMIVVAKKILVYCNSVTLQYTKIFFATTIN